ncbi:uncharacterized protein LOC144433313 [Glandiceps talaboti]
MEDTCSFTIDVYDHENPKITCPANIEVNTEYNIATATVTWEIATATDNSGDVEVEPVSWSRSKDYHSLLLLIAKFQLADGLTIREGRVEVQQTDYWESVCDSGWDINDANVMCKQQGFDDGAIKPLYASVYGRGEGVVYGMDLTCVGTEDSITSCPSQQVSATCDHSKDASVICKSKVRLVGNTPYEGQVQVLYNNEWGSVCDDQWDFTDAALTCLQLERVRVVNGGRKNRGRVEVFMVGRWGTVCDDNWDINDANVVCRELGFAEGAASAPKSAACGSGDGDIWMSQTNCGGHEQSLFYCPSRKQFGIDNCNHGNDASVECKEPSARLIGGNTPYEGRLEVFITLEWGTVCNKRFHLIDADVVCRSLGYPLGAIDILNANYFGTSTDPILMKFVNCDGSEPGISSCAYTTDTNDCSHAKDVGIICAANVRLSEKTSDNTGKVEVYVDGVWKVILNDLWDKQNSDVVCRELGFTLGANEIDCCPQYPRGSTPVWGDKVQCRGSERRITECWHTDTITGQNEVGVSCKVPEVRLVGYTPYEGRVEMQMNGEWGTVCDDDWTIDDANIICRSLGFERGASNALPSAFYGPGVVNISLQYPECHGHEQNIAFCPSVRPTRGLGCTHDDDVSVLCRAPFRLIDGLRLAPYEGRVEVYVDGNWGRVCDTNWDVNDAKVLCKELGFDTQDSPGAELLETNSYTVGNGPAYMDNLQCNGNEATLNDCHFQHNPTSSCQDATAKCKRRVRLEGGFSYFDGRVEVFHHGEWGIVCDQDFDINDADVVCKENDFPLGLDFFQPAGVYGAPNLPIWMSGSKCIGNELTIWECPAQPPVGRSGCTAYDEVNLYCKPPIRFIGGGVPYAGRVDIYLDREWGTICDIGWDDIDAEVVCTELGYPFGGKVKKFAEGTGPVWFENVDCSGTEKTILDCTDQNDKGKTSCGHSQDAGAACAKPIRLVDGNGRVGTSAGRIEFYRNGTWGTVCDDYWDIHDGNVICRELGYPNGAELVLHKSVYAPISLVPMWLTDIGCDGSEDSILRCTVNQVPLCDDSELASVVCNVDPAVELYWPMDEISTDVPSSIPGANGVDAEVHGSVSLVNDSIFQNAVLLKGEGQWIDLGDFHECCVTDLASCDRGVTVSMWFKTGNLEEKLVILQSGTDTVNGLAFKFLMDHFEATVANSSVAWTARFTGEFNQWSQLVITWKYSEGLSVYIDGFLVTEDTTGAPTTDSGYTEESARVVLGQNKARNDKLAEVYIDELEITEEYMFDAEPRNLAFNKASYLSTTYRTDHRYSPIMAVDGILDTFCQTAKGDPNAYLQIDLGRVYGMTHVVLRSADDDVSGAQVLVSNTLDIKQSVRCGPIFDTSKFATFTAYCSGSGVMFGRYVSVTSGDQRHDSSLKLAEVQVFSDPSFLGCYSNNGQFSQIDIGIDAPRIGDCRHHCSDLEFAFSALSNDRHCFCGNALDSGQISSSEGCSLYLKYSPDDFTLLPKEQSGNQFYSFPTTNQLNVFKSGSIFETFVEPEAGIIIDKDCYSHESNSFRAKHVNDVYMPHEVLECWFSISIGDYDLLVPFYIDFFDFFEAIADEVWTGQMYNFNISYINPSVYMFNISVDHFLGSFFSLKQIVVTAQTGPTLGSVLDKEYRNEEISGLSVANISVREDQLTVEQDETLFRMFLVDGNATTCDWDFGDGITDQTFHTKYGLVNINHVYDHDTHGPVITNVKCCNDIDCTEHTFFRYVKTIFSSFEPRPPFTIEFGENAIVTWNIQDDAEVNMLLQMEDQNGNGKKELPLDYHEGAYVIKKEEYQCTGMRNIFLKVINPPKDDVTHITSLFSQASVTTIDMDFEVEYSETDFKSLIGETGEVLEEIEVGKNLTLIGSTYNGTNIVRILTFGDEQIDDVGQIELLSDGTVEQTAIHKYKKKGDRDIKMVAVNEHTLLTASHPLNVYTMCDMPQVWINGRGKSSLSPRVHYRSDPLTVTSLVTYTCRENETEATFTWFAKKIVNGDKYELDIPSSERFSISFPAKYFEYGLIRISLTVELVDISNVDPGTDHVYVDIVRAPPIVVIEGSFQRTQSMYFDMIFDGSRSADPESETGSITLIWSCHLPNTAPPILSSDSPTIQFKACGIDESAIEKTNGNTGLVIARSVLKNVTYIVRLTLFTHDNLEQYFQQTVDVVDGYPPNAKLKCILNCGEIISSMYTTSYKLICQDCTSVGTSVMAWSLYERDHITEEYNYVEDFDLYTVTGTNGSSLVIKEEVFSKGTEYKLVAFIDVPGRGRSHSIDYFKTASTPYGGTCKVLPEAGKALITKFVAVCKGWQRNETVITDVDERKLIDPGLKYRIQLSYGGEIYGSDFYYADDPLTPNMSLPEGPTENNHIWEVIISVEDQYGEKNATTIHVKVLPLEYDEDVIKTYFGRADVFRRLDNPIQANQMILTISSLLNKWSNQSSNATWTAMIEKLRSEISELWEFSTTLLLTPQAVSQTASALTYSTAIPSQVGKKTQSVSAKAMSRAADAMASMSQDSNLAQTQVRKSAEDILVSAASLLVAVNPPVVQEEVRDNETLTKTETVRKVEDPRHVSQTTNSVVGAVSSFSDSILRRMLPGEPKVNFSSNGVSVQLERTTSDDAANKSIPFSKGKFSLASAESMFKDKNYSSVDVKVVEYDRNPFIWHKTADLVRSSIISVELRDDNDSVIEQKDNEEDFVFSMNYIREEEIVEEVENVTEPANDTIDDTMVAPQFYIFNVTASGTAVRVMIMPNNTNATYVVYIRYGDFPEDDAFDFRFVVPLDFIFTGRMMDLSFGLEYKQDDGTVFHQDHIKVVKNLYHVTDGPVQRSTPSTMPMADASNDGQKRYGPVDIELEGSRDLPQGVVGNESSYDIFIPSTDIRRAGTYYMEIKEFIEWNETIPIIDNVVTPYKIRIHTATCRYWHAASERWLTNGCSVSPLSVPNQTVCQCNHLTNFGVDSFYVPINPIDWKKVLEGFQNFGDNVLVFSVVVMIIIIYFIMLYFLRKKDKEDLIRWSATPLLDNRPQDEYIYHITVYTSYGSSAGTRSNIYFRLSGKNGDTGNRRLKDEYAKAFSSGSVNHFLLNVPADLGPLEYFHVWHDSTGLGDDASWRLDRVVICDLQTGRWFCFQCNDWLAVDIGDGKVDRALNASGITSITNFKTLFGWRKQKSLTDDHLWFSLFLRPTWSNFTRVQRLSCCLSLLFAYLISNAMFYKTDTEAAKATYTWIVFGPIRFSLQQIYIGTMCGIIIFPVNVLIVQMFRKSRRRKNGLWSKFVKKVKVRGFTVKKNNAVVELDLSKPKDKRSEDVVEQSRDKSGFMLPWWCIYIGWVAVFLTTLTAASFVIFYSMMWGPVKSADWLTSCMTSFAESVFFMEPMQALLLASVLAAFIRNPEVESFKKMEEGVDNEESSSIKEMAPRHKAYSMFNVPDVAKGPLRQNKLEPIRQRRTKEKKMMAVLYGIIIYSAFIGITIELCTYVRDPLGYMFNQYLHNSYIAPKPKFHKIKTPGEFWDWMDKIWIPSVYPDVGENDSQIITADNMTYRVGFPRLRQQRLKTSECYMKWNALDCESEEEERSDYDIGWSSIANLSDYEIENTTSPWRYVPVNDGEASDYFGTHGHYDSSGYYATLKGNRSYALELLTSLSDSSWFDLRTKVILLEFDLYNPNSNLFASVVYALECLNTGGIETRATHHIFRVLHSVFDSRIIYDRKAIVIFLCWVFFSLFSLYMMYSIIRRLKVQRVDFFRIPWNYFDLLVTITAIASVCMAIFVEVVSSGIIHNVVTGVDNNLMHVATLNETFTNILCIVVFLAIIRYLKLLRFNKRMFLLSLTLKNAAPGLISFLILFVISMLAYLHMGHLMFYIYVDEFKSVRDTLSYLFTIMLGKFPKLADFDMASSFWRWFLFAYWVTQNVFLMNIFIAVINDAFATARDENKKKRNYFEMVQYLTARLKDKIITLGIIHDKEKKADEEGDLEEIDKSLIKFDEIWLKLDERVDKLYKEENGK